MGEHCSTEEYGGTVCHSHQMGWEMMGCTELALPRVECNGAWLTGVMAECDHCTVRVEEGGHGSCGQYCGEHGLHCTEAMEAHGDEMECEGGAMRPCDAELSEGMICRCDGYVDAPAPMPPNKLVAMKCQEEVEGYLECMKPRELAADYYEHIKDVRPWVDRASRAVHANCTVYPAEECHNPPTVEFQAESESECLDVCHEDAYNWNRSCTGGSFSNGTDGNGSGMCSLYYWTEPTVSTLPVPGMPNMGLSWQAAAQHADDMHGRLPTAEEFREFKISDGPVDHWQPISDEVGLWIQSGDAGRWGMTEGHEGGWYTSEDVNAHRPNTAGTSGGSSVDYFYVMFGGGDHRCMPTGGDDSGGNHTGMDDSGGDHTGMNDSGGDHTGEDNMSAGGNHARRRLSDHMSTRFECSGPMPDPPMMPPPEGECRVILYDGCFEGHMEEFGKGHHGLHDDNLGDQVESIRVLGEGCEATLWEHGGEHMGRSFTFGEGDYDCDEFMSRADANSASFLVVSRPMEEHGCRVVLYDDCLSGHAVALPEGHHELHQYDIGDRANSIMVSGAGCKATLWEHGHHSGESWIFTEGTYDCHDFSMRADGDSASFMEVSRGGGGDEESCGPYTVRITRQRARELGAYQVGPECSK